MCVVRTLIMCASVFLVTTFFPQAVYAGEGYGYGGYENQSAENSSTPQRPKKPGAGPTKYIPSLTDLGDMQDPSDPDSLWHNRDRDADKTLNTYPRFIPKVRPVISKDYNSEAYPHLRNMAKYCNKKWRGQRCLRHLSALGIDLTKDYMKKIHYSKSTPEDLKEPSKEMLRKSCTGIIVHSNEEIAPIVMSNKMKQCVNAMTQVSNMTGEYPDRDLRQLAMSSTFCIVREAKCTMIENQLDLIVPPKKSSEQIAPSK